MSSNGDPAVVAAVGIAMRTGGSTSAENVRIIKQAYEPILADLRQQITILADAYKTVAEDLQQVTVERRDLIKQLHAAKVELAARHHGPQPEQEHVERGVTVVPAPVSTCPEPEHGMPCGDPMPCAVHPANDPRCAIFGCNRRIVWSAGARGWVHVEARQTPYDHQATPPPLDVPEAESPEPSTDEYYRLKIARNALTLLKERRRSDGAELATIDDMIREADVLIGRNRCAPSSDQHSEQCDGRCGKSGEDASPPISDPNAAPGPVVCPCCGHDDPHEKLGYMCRTCSGNGRGGSGVCVKVFRERTLAAIKEVGKPWQRRAEQAALQLAAREREVAELRKQLAEAIIAEDVQRALHTHMLLSEHSTPRPADVKPGWMWCVKRGQGCTYTVPSNAYCKVHGRMDACWANADGGGKGTGA